MNTLYQSPSRRYPSRITRSTYFVRWIGFVVGSFVAGKLMDTSSLLLTMGGVALLLVFFVGLFRYALVPRLHDMGVEPAWAWSLLFFVHGVSFLFLLALLLVPTDAFVERRHLV